MFAKILPFLFFLVWFSPLFSADTRDYYRAMHNVAKLIAPKGGSGTAWAVSYKGKRYTLSNAHVCAIAKKQGTTWMKAQRELREDFIEILAMDEEKDLCLLSRMPEAEGFELANSWFAAQPVTVYGHPVGNPLTISEGVLIKQGTVEIMEEDVPLKECHGRGLQRGKMESPFGSVPVCVRTLSAVYLTARVFPGNSGSPVINLVGEVVGIVFASQSRTSFGYAISLESMKEFLERNLGQKNSKSN